jgi:hypothetical protein
MSKLSFLKLAAAAGLLFGGSIASAQVTTVDPNSVVSAPASASALAATQAPELDSGVLQDQPVADSEYQPVDSGSQQPWDQSQQPAQPAAQGEASAAPSSAAQRAEDSIRNNNVARKDVFTAAEGVFGRGAEGLGDMIEKLLRDNGEPTAYITGREAGGAFVFGVRYGSGTLHHQIEGDRPVYWTGPSLGIDFGADASKVFVLVYNLHDSQKLYHRYPAAEGNAYVVGGFTASYLRRGDIVLIPVRLGVGARLGINAGYMRFSERNRWLPF